ncbi:hypothetical protein M5K25_027150 [Dendrobium thyrsiflorum]|uniref:Uncharacterized protein n=1 Tax=Dendrobium thyrsiflorum TaxID=117978 RepID=A0ABD0TZ82_DENTH
MGWSLAKRRKRLEAETKEEKLASFPRRRRREVEQARKLFQENPQPLNSPPNSHKTATQQPIGKGKGEGQQPSTGSQTSPRDSSPAGKVHGNNSSKARNSREPRSQEASPNRQHKSQTAGTGTATQQGNRSPPTQETKRAGQKPKPTFTRKEQMYGAD